MTHTRINNTLARATQHHGNGHKKKGGWLAPLAMAASSILPWAIDKIFPSRGSGVRRGYKGIKKHAKGRAKHKHHKGGRRRGKAITTPISSGPLP